MLKVLGAFAFIAVAFACVIFGMRFLFFWLLKDAELEPWAKELYDERKKQIDAVEKIRKGKGRVSYMRGS